MIFYFSGSNGLDELFLIYAKMTWPRWRETAVFEWLLRNIDKLCTKFDTILDVRVTKLIRYFLFYISFT